MKPKLLYVILIAVIGIVITVASVNVVLAASLTGGATNPSSSFYDKNGYYAIKFYTATQGTIKYITVQFPSGTIMPNAAVISINGIGDGTATKLYSGQSTPKVIYTITNPVNVPSGTAISLLIIKVRNAPTPGSASLSVTTNDTSGNVIDGPTSITFGLNDISQGPFTLDSTNDRIGINNASPSHTLDVGGDIGISGNITSTASSGKTLKITPPTNGAICIGAGC